MTISFNRMVQSLAAADFIILIPESGDNDRTIANYAGMNDADDAFMLGAQLWDDIRLPHDREYHRVSLQPGNMRGFVSGGVTIIPVKAGRA